MLALSAVQYIQEQDNKELPSLTMELGVSCATEYLTGENIWLVDENDNPILKNVYLSELETNRRKFASLLATSDIPDTVQLRVELQKGGNVIHSEVVKISPQLYTDPLRESETRPLETIDIL